VIEWLLPLVAVLLVAANAVFVAAAFSFITVERSTVERRTEGGGARSASVLRALRTLSTQLSWAQLGITVTSLLVGFIAEPVVCSSSGWAGSRSSGTASASAPVEVGPADRDPPGRTTGGPAAPRADRGVPRP